MKLPTFPRGLRLSKQELFYLEQWTALLIGFVCFGASAWAAFSGFTQFSGARHSWFAEGALATVKCSLTINLVLIGTALVRFAFYKPTPKNLANPVPGQQKRMAEESARPDKSSGTPLLKSISIQQGRG